MDAGSVRVAFYWSLKDVILDAFVSLDQKMNVHFYPREEIHFSWHCRGSKINVILKYHDMFIEQFLEVPPNFRVLS